MKKLSLRSKLWLGFGSLLAILMVVAGVGYKSAVDNRSLVRSVQRSVAQQNLAAAIELAVEKERVGGRNVLLHDDDAYLRTSRAEFDRRMADLKALLTSAASRERVEQIGEKNAAYTDFINQAFAKHRAGDQAGALEIYYGPPAQKVTAELKQSSDDLVGWFGKQATESGAEQVAQSSRSIPLILIFSGLGLAVGVTVASLLARSIISSISPIAKGMASISNHDLCIPDVEVHSQDELGRLSESLNTMKANLSRMVHSITLSAEQLAAATEEIAQGAKQSSTSAHSEADQATQTASAMAEMSAAVREVAGHAQRASEASAHSAEAARLGGKVADDALATMSNIANSTRNAADRVLELGRSSEKIGNIVEVITEIAGQTNLLALNAAIEAARAGEQGRGFAVVAGEVRRLAERTTAATQEIATMIQAIQAETRVAVEAIEKGNREVELGVQKTGESGRALTEIIALSEQVGHMIAQIATASSQQLGAVEQISSSVSQISNLTQASSATADQTADACGNLSALASEMHRLVNEFCIQDSANASDRRSPGSAPMRAGRAEAYRSLRPAAT